MGLCFCDVDVGYTSAPVLRSFNYRFPRGALIGLRGPNGCGKSTLLKAAVGTAKIFAGCIEISDIDIGEFSVERRCRGRISFMPQIGAVYAALTVSENLKAAVATQVPSDRRRAYRNATVLFRERHPDVALGSRASSLSVGEARTLGFVCSIVRRSEWYLFDEPTAGVDTSGSAWIFSKLRELVIQGRGVLVVEQRVLFLEQFCDSVLELTQCGCLRKL